MERGPRDSSSTPVRMSFESRLAGLERIGSMRSGFMVRESTASSMGRGSTMSEAVPSHEISKEAPSHELVDDPAEQASGTALAGGLAPSPVVTQTPASAPDHRLLTRRALC